MAKVKEQNSVEDLPRFIFRCCGRYFTKQKEVAGVRTRQAKDFKVDIQVLEKDIDLFIEKHRNVGKQIDDKNDPLKVTNEVKEEVFRNYSGVLRKKLVPLKLSAIAEQNGGFEDFSRIRDMRVEEVIGINGARVEDLNLPINMLSLSQISVFCSKNGILSDVIDVNSYLNLDDLRADLYEYMDSPEVFRQKVESGSTKSLKNGKRTSAYFEERERERRFKEINQISMSSAVDGKRGVVKGVPVVSIKKKTVDDSVEIAEEALGVNTLF